MKLPPKTLHRPRVFDDNVSDLTMTYPDTIHPPHNNNNINNEQGDESSSTASPTKKRNKLGKYLKLKRSRGNANATNYTTTSGSKSEGSGYSYHSPTRSQSHTVQQLNAQRGDYSKSNNVATNFKSTAADQLVAKMFSKNSNSDTNNSSNVGGSNYRNGEERARSWKSESLDSSLDRSNNGRSNNGHESTPSRNSNSQPNSNHKRSSNNSNQSQNNHNNNSSSSSSKNSGNEGMEYSTMNITKSQAGGYRDEAVGAAAMAVEFAAAGTTAAGSDAIGSGGINESENAGNENNFSRGVRMKREERSDVVDRSRGLDGAAPQSKRTHHDNLSDLELLGLTVQCINSALQSASNLRNSTSTTDSNTNDDDDAKLSNYSHISSFKFNPRGCVWYATLVRKEIHIPIKVTCHASDDYNHRKVSSPSKSASSTSGTANVKRATYTVTISYYQPSSNNTHWKSSFRNNFPSVGTEDLSSLWMHNSVEITNSVEWLRRKFKRWIVRSLQGRMGDALPEVMVILPEKRKEKEVVDTSRMGDDKRGVITRRAVEGNNGGPSKSQQPLERSLKSTDPSTVKTVTTCSMSTHSPEREVQSSSLEGERRMKEARDELTGQKTISFRSGTDSVIVEKRTLDRFRGGLVSQHTMRRLMVENDDDDDDSDEEEETTEKRSRGYSNASSTKVISLSDGQRQKREESEQRLISQDTMKRIFVRDEGNIGDEQDDAVQDAYGEKHVLKSERGAVDGDVNGTVTETCEGDKSIDDGSAPKEISVRSSRTSRASVHDVDQYRQGLMSENTMKRILDGEEKNDGFKHQADETFSGENGSYSNDLSLKIKKNSSPTSQQAMEKFKRGLISESTMKRIILKEEEKEVERVVNAMKAEHRAEGEIRVAQAGLLSRKTISNMKLGAKYGLDDGSDSSVNNLDAEREELDNTKRENSWDEGSQPSTEADAGNQFRRDSFATGGEFRQARKGLVSQHTVRRLSMVKMDEPPSQRNDQANVENKDFNKSEASLKSARRPKRIVCRTESANSMNVDSLLSTDTGSEMDFRRDSFGSSGEFRQARRGLVSQRTMRRLSNESNESGSEHDEDGAAHDQGDDRLPTRRSYSRGEMHMMMRGCISRRSIHSVEEKDKDESKRVPSQIQVSFLNTLNDNSSESAQEDLKIEDTAKEENDTIARAKKIVYREEDKDENDGMLVFSNNELEQSKKLDILTEGQYFLGISMLVYMYSHLRETCRMGHTRCSMHDIDTHSVQSQYKGGNLSKYLSGTKTAGSIIRLVIDELDDANEDDADHEIVGGESKEYERQQTAQFRKWINESRISQMDEETEEMLREMKRKVARHRWKRAISAVIISYRISGGKPPRWDNPVVAPGCENCNRFVDMKDVMSKTMKKQPKYFKEGSVMNNLIESGIEVVWFSDLSQNDVVYGICVNREEKKIIIVFRGTVNSHNWAMNFKFDTNEYRNPIKCDYPGREDELSLHSGFALYLLRKRKDTGMSKMDEIFEKVEQVGRELAPNGDYKLCITGHSLGGALATLCGFYCGSKPKFAHLSTIYIWTFAAPRVGTQAFMYAYQHLERTGRIRHARFSCTNDIVPLIPFCNFEYDDLQFYKHVGIRVQLHDTGRIGKWRLRNNLDVTYPLKHDWASESRRLLMNNIFANLNTPKGFKDFHGLTEHQKRLHFAMTYRRALGSSTLNSDQRRKRIKTLDEYYLIRADIATEGIAEEVVDIRKATREKKKGGSSSKWLVRLLVLLLLFTWVLLILSITTDIPLHCVLVPFTMTLHGIQQAVHLPLTLPSIIYESATFRVNHMIHSLLGGNRHVSKSSFVARKAPSNMDVMKTLAKQRASNNVSRQTKDIIDAKSILRQNDNSKFHLLERTSTRLYNLASAVDNRAYPKLTIDVPEDDFNAYESLGQGYAGEEVSDDADDVTAQLDAIESQLQPIQEYATSIAFDLKLDNGLYLVGAGVRKKSVVKVYAVAMYSEPRVLLSASSSPASLHDAARTFDPPSSMTSFVLEMVYSAGAEKIAGAIGESVKPRYNGNPADIEVLEALIVEGVNGIGGQATKGTTFRFDCSGEGVAVNTNGVEQGVAAFSGLGSAFVDVYMDDNSVSPTLKESCLSNWSSDDRKSIATSLVEVASSSGHLDQVDSNGKTAVDDATMKLRNIESQLKPIQEYATSVAFNPKLEDGLYLVGAGVRKKSVVKVYAVALYGSASVLSSISSPAKLHNAARSFDTSTPSTIFMLEMTYSASAEKIGGAIADSVKPRHSGSASDIRVLESLIVEGVNRKGGQASKGTIFRFDCSEKGVTVSVDGFVQGTATAAGLGSAFVDVFLDDNAVSPTLVSSCIDTWSNPQAKALAASLLKLSGPSDETNLDEIDEEGSSSYLEKAVESKMKPIQEYATSVSFAPKLDDGLYLVGAGVRKKSIVKVYAVAMYSSANVIQSISNESASSLQNAARSFSPASPKTAFVLEMTYSAGAEKIAGAIAESVKPRYNGKPSDINVLEELIVKGVNLKGGQASKGTVFRFDCSQEGVRVSVDGSNQGIAAFEGMGSAFVDVFLDENAVSPSLVDSCMDTWSKVSL